MIVLAHLTKVTQQHSLNLELTSSQPLHGAEAIPPKQSETMTHLPDPISQSANQPIRFLRKRSYQTAFCVGPRCSHYLGYLPYCAAVYRLLRHLILAADVAGGWF